MSLNTKRLLLGLIASAVGLAVTAGIIYLRIPIPGSDVLLGSVYHFGFGTTPEKFAYSNVILLFLSTAALAAIWLDYFMKTDLLKS